MIATVEVDGGQVPLDMVHWNAFVPTDKNLMTEVGELSVTIDPLPDNKVQAPVPTVGVFAAMIAEEFGQIVCERPALDTVGRRSRTTDTVEVEGAHTLFEMVH